MRDTSFGRLQTTHRAIAHARIGFLVALVLLLCPRARADDELVLTWNVAGAATCPDRAWAEQRLYEHLGRASDNDVRDSLHAEVQIHGGADGLTLQLQMHQAERALGERSISGSDCRELSEAALLIVALSLAEARERAQEQAPTAAPPPPAPERVVEPMAKSERMQSSVSESVWSVRADGLVEHGLFTPIGFGAQLAASYQRAVWSVEVAGVWLASRKLDGVLRSADGGRSELEVSLWAGRTLGCAWWQKSRVRLGPCSGVELGQVRGRAVGATQTAGERGHSLWGAALLAARLYVELSERWAVLVASEHLLRLTHLRFVTVDEATGARALAYEAPRYQTRATLGAQVRF